MNNSTALVKVDRQAIEQMDNDILALLPGAQKMPPGIRRSLAQACLIYGLDPFMKEIMACEFKGQWTLYVGVAGMRTAARNSNQGRYIGRILMPLNDAIAQELFYGMSAQEVRKANGIKDGDITWVCAVFKEGNSHPFVELGICGPSMPQAYKESRIPDWKMAKARAERTALAAAFALPFSLNERLDALLAEEVEAGIPEETVEGEVIESPLSPPPPLPKKGNNQGDNKHWVQTAARNAFWAQTNEMGLSNDEVHEALQVPSVKDFPGTMQQALAIIQEWIDCQTAQEEADDLPEGPPGTWQHSFDPGPDGYGEDAEEA